MPRLGPHTKGYKKRKTKKAKETYTVPVTDVLGRKKTRMKVPHIGRRANKRKLET
jgi:hypothetical protein